jgi:hypothetical protein
MRQAEKGDLSRSAGLTDRAPKAGRRLAPDVTRNLFVIETSDLTGASLDKAGAIHPLKRVGNIKRG